jgi:hypothetical protein
MHDLAHHVAAARGDVRRVDGELARLARVLGVLPHGAGQLFHARGGLLQRSGLLLGTLRQIGVTHRDLARAGVDRFGAAVDRFHHRREAVLHLLDAAEQAPDLVGAEHVHRVRQVACGDPLEAFGCVVERLHDQAAQRETDQHHQHQRDQPHCDDQRGHERDVRLRRRLLIGRALQQGLHDRRSGRVVSNEERADLRIRNRVKARLIARAQRRELRIDAVVHHGRTARQQVVDEGLVNAGLRRIYKRLPALVAFGEQFLRPVQHGLRFVGIARGGKRVVPVNRKARAQQVARRIVERMNGHQIAACDTVKRLARAIQRGEAERADHDRQCDQNDPDHGQRRTNRPPA